MEEEKTNNNEAIEEEQTAGAQEGEKLFTQAELEAIINKRLARERAKEQKAPAVSDEDLTRRAAMLDCKEYVLNNGLSMDLLEILDTNNVELFKEKAERLQAINAAKRETKTEYPALKDAGEVRKINDESAQIRAAFARTTHKPKEYIKR